MGGLDDLLKELDDLPSGHKANAKTQQVTQHQHGRSGSTGHLAPRPTAVSNSTAQITTSQTSHSHGRSASVSGEPRQAKKKDDLEALLSELDFGGTPNNSITGRPGVSTSSALNAAAQKLSQPPGMSKTSSQIGSKQKCTGVFVGGTAFPRGRQGAVGGLTMCDALRCTKCDFRVEQFSNKEWDSDVDYLFFRNNFPTESKLAPKMRQRPGSVAYCCQCSWLSAKAESKVDFASEVRWVCAGHLTE